MIEEMDHVFHENILNELNKLTLKGYQNYQVMNDNPLRILFSSIYLEDDNIGHEAHLGGAIAGFFSTIIISPAVVFTKLFTVLILLIPIVYFYIKSK